MNLRIQFISLIEDKPVFPLSKALEQGERAHRRVALFLNSTARLAIPSLPCYFCFSAPRSWFWSTCAASASGKDEERLHVYKEVEENQPR